eukprot:IDg6232t1
MFGSVRCCTFLTVDSDSALSLSQAVLMRYPSCLLRTVRKLLLKLFASPFTFLNFYAELA